MKVGSKNGCDSQNVDGLQNEGGQQK